MGKNKISNIQLGLMAFASFYGSTAIFNGALGAKRDAWIASILSWVIGIVLVTIILVISKLNNGKNLVEILDSCFGKILGKMIAFFYVLYFLYIASMNIRGFGEFMVTVSYDATPLVVLMAIEAIVVVYAARSGLATMGRTAELFVPFIPIPILIMSYSIISIHDISVFKPILTQIKPVIMATSITTATIYGDFLPFLMILPYTNKEKGRFGAVYSALWVIGVLHLLIVVRESMLIGPGLFESIMFPIHVAAQMLKVINMDPFIDINLLFGGSFKILTHLYAATKIVAELFGVEDEKPLVCAFAVFVFTMANWLFPNLVQMQKYLNSVANILPRVPFQIVFPIIILIISIVKLYMKPTDQNLSNNN